MELSRVSLYYTKPFETATTFQLQLPSPSSLSVVFCRQCVRSPFLCFLFSVLSSSHWAPQLFLSLMSDMLLVFFFSGLPADPSRLRVKNRFFFCVECKGEKKVRDWGWREVQVWVCIWSKDLQRPVFESKSTTANLMLHPCVNPGASISQILLLDISFIFCFFLPFLGSFFLHCYINNHIKSVSCEKYGCQKLLPEHQLSVHIHVHMLLSFVNRWVSVCCISCVTCNVNNFY